MNRQHRLVWNARTASPVPAPETARGHGRADAVVTGGPGTVDALSPPTLRRSALGVCAALLTMSAPGWALDANTLPTAGAVASGSATLNLSGNTLNINQTSNRAVINWGSFSVGSAAGVNFAQPGSSSVVLNRVLGNEASQIQGRLTANGQVFLVNPNGLLIGRGAQVNVHGLVGSTQDVADADIGTARARLNGRAGTVRNEGMITIGEGGYVVLAGGQVSNAGQINARMGSVHLAAGSATTVDFRGDGLVQVAVDAGAARALTENTGAIQADGGVVRLSAKAADQLVSAVVNNRGTIEARGLVLRNGVIELAGDLINNSGTISANGTPAAPRGGTVTLTARSIVQNGRISADGSGPDGQGGQVNLRASHALLQTTAGHVSADGEKAGGTVVMDGGELAYLSGAVSANGTGTRAAGGDVVASAAHLTLAGIALSADGAVQGGQVLVGGDAHGGRAGMHGVANAKSTYVSAGSTISAHGANGRIVVWSDGRTAYAGDAQTGANGFIEISGAGQLVFGGTADAGEGGHVLLDPTDLVIGDVAPTDYVDLSDPSPQGGTQHGGGGVTDLGYGLIAVAKPLDNLKGNETGAVYLYDTHGHKLESVFYGSTALDRVGLGGVTLLDNGNFVINSYDWNASPRVTDSHVGAVSWVNRLTFQFSDNTTVISAANSLVGSQAGDRVGSGGVVALKTVDVSGHYVVASPEWGSAGAIEQGLGAVTWLNGLSGRDTNSGFGAVSAANSIVGTNPRDRIGGGSDSVGGHGGVVALANGHYVVYSPFWNSDTGAVTWGHGDNGSTVGAVSDRNSLVGTNPGDRVGYGASAPNGGPNQAGVVELSDGNYVIVSPQWDGGRGAVTWALGASATAAEVNATNSLVGVNQSVGLIAGDEIGSGGVSALPGGNYVVNSPFWSNDDPNNGLQLHVGASTWVPGETELGLGTLALIGPVVSPINSLIGTHAEDRVGLGGSVVLRDGRYVVISPMWSSEVGAVTVRSVSVVNRTVVGAAGEVAPGNSLVGSQAGDHVGSGGVTVLDNGLFVVASPDWSDGPIGRVGAVTLTDGTLSDVNAFNSLTGTLTGDRVGSGGVVALRGTQDAYVVISPEWDSGGVAGQGLGAVTWADGSLFDRLHPSAGNTGAVTDLNSLTGSGAGDQVGSGGVVALANGHYVVISPDWSRVNLDPVSGAVVSTDVAVGAVTWRPGKPTIGLDPAEGALIDPHLNPESTSFVGRHTGDRLGSGGVVPIIDLGGANGPTSQYAIVSPHLSQADGSGADSGGVWLVLTDTPSGTLSPARLASLAGAGQTVTLAASRNIIVNSAVVVDGALELEAGRDIVINANGSLTSNAPEVALSLVAQGAFTNHAGQTALSTPNGQWQVWTADPARDTLGDLPFDFRQYNATAGVTPVLGVGNGVFHTLAPRVTAELSGTAAKTYDRLFDASGDNLSWTAVGLAANESATLTASHYTYATNQAGSQIDVTGHGVAADIVTLASNGRLVPVYGYQIANPKGEATAVGAGTIDRLALSVSGTSVTPKPFNGQTDVTLRGGALVGVITGDEVTLTQQGQFQRSEPGTDIPVDVTAQIAGLHSGNYTLAGYQVLGEILPPLTPPSLPGGSTSPRPPPPPAPTPPPPAPTPPPPAPTPPPPAPSPAPVDGATDAGAGTGTTTGTGSTTTTTTPNPASANGGTVPRGNGGGLVQIVDGGVSGPTRPGTLQPPAPAPATSLAPAPVVAQTPAPAPATATPTAPRPAPRPAPVSRAPAPAVVPTPVVDAARPPVPEAVPVQVVEVAAPAVLTAVAPVPTPAPKPVAPRSTTPRVAKAAAATPAAEPMPAAVPAQPPAPVAATDETATAATVAPTAAATSLSRAAEPARPPSPRRTVIKVPFLGEIDITPGAGLPTTAAGGAGLAGAVLTTLALLLAWRRKRQAEAVQLPDTGPL